MCALHKDAISEPFRSANLDAASEYMHALRGLRQRLSVVSEEPNEEGLQRCLKENDWCLKAIPKVRLYNNNLEG
jgi:hypothetical protein